jgi:hypothetical protein
MKILTNYTSKSSLTYKMNYYEYMDLVLISDYGYGLNILQLLKNSNNEYSFIKLYNHNYKDNYPLSYKPIDAILVNNKTVFLLNYINYVVVIDISFLINYDIEQIPYTGSIKYVLETKN